MHAVRDRAAAVVRSAGCATTPPEEDPVVQKLTELDSRLLRIERVLANQSLLDLSQRIEAAQAETRTLRGQLDELQHTLSKTQEQQRELYGDRRSSPRGARRHRRRRGCGRWHAGCARAGLPVPQGDDRANYQAAFDLLKDGKYPEAISGFKQFLTTFPDSALADNAQYWLGEAHYVTKQYPDALRDFRTVLEKYPDSRKMPDALLKIGLLQLRAEELARSALRAGPGRAARYPATRRPAQLASGALKRLLASADGRGGQTMSTRRRRQRRRLKLTEIFLSMQGEADSVGWPTVFVRLTGCPLRCQYCDTQYAFYGGEWSDARRGARARGGVRRRHVCVTGGEPLAQKDCLELLRRLCDAGYRVSLETSGAIDIAAVDPRVVRVVDVKTPGSGEVARNRSRTSLCCAPTSRSSS